MDMTADYLHIFEDHAPTEKIIILLLGLQFSHKPLEVVCPYCHCEIISKMRWLVGLYILVWLDLLIWVLNGLFLCAFLDTLNILHVSTLL